jgi:septation ring formation regulator EzrA
MSTKQRERFDEVQTNITKTQTQIEESFSQQNELFLSELGKQSLLITESSTRDSKTLQSSVTAQFDLLKEATQDVAGKADEIEEKIDKLEEGDEKLRETLESMVSSGDGIKRQLNRVEKLVSGLSGLNGDMKGNELAKAQNGLQKGFDIFAQYVFLRSAATSVSYHRIQLKFRYSELTPFRWKRLLLKVKIPLKYRRLVTRTAALHL